VEAQPVVGSIRQPRLRFTLRLLLALVTLVCICFAIWSHRAREQRRVVERIKTTGGDVYYDFQRPWHRLSSQATESRVPRWLLDGLGVDYFHEVTEVDVLDPAILPELVRFRSLKCLTVSNRSLTDASFAPVARLRKLKALSIYPNASGPAVTKVGDQTLRIIGELPVLELANVLGSQITSNGLEALARSTSLKRLQVVSNDGSIDGDASKPFRRVGRAHVLIQRWSPGDGGKVEKVVSEFDPN
jgi:hypothetical protein